MQLNSGVTRIFGGFLALGLTACGGKSPTQPHHSDLDWVQSRSDTTRYAYLEASDLAGEFLMGVSVIKTDDFISNALNMVLRPLTVKLKQNGTKLDVRTAAENELLMSFDLALKNSRYEVDFASAGNDLQLRGIVDFLGGIYTASSRNGYWLSEGAPEVLAISQDSDTVVVDLLHTVSQAILTDDGTAIDRIVSDHPGKVTLRLFLKRASSLPRLGVDRQVADGKAKSIGYFGADFVSDNDQVGIQRFALGDAVDAQASVTFYLKDVPAAFQDVARQAILSWNKAFDHDVIKVEVAPESMDVGDPRLNVVKWFDGLDENVGWAGVAKMIVDPSSGLVMGGNLYINGSSVLNMYRGITDFSQRVMAQQGVQQQQQLTGSIGHARLESDVGETPVIPFATTVSKDFETYMKDYYLETIAHEVGHVLGLRHNFRGSTALAAGESASVMDYAPRSERDHYKGPGTYDLAAIRWGYMGVEPAADLPFCSDEDLWKFYDCSQGDWNDTVEYNIKGLIDGTDLLAKSKIDVAKDSYISSMAGVLENVLKIKKLQDQLPSGTRSSIVSRIDAAYEHLYAALPDAALTGVDLATVQTNLVKLRELTKKKEDELRAQGRL